MTAVMAAAIFGTAKAQTSATMTHAIKVPLVLSITTVPANATYNYDLNEGHLTSATPVELAFTKFVVRSNVNWKLSANWSVTGSTTASANNTTLNASISTVRNAMQFSTDNATWISLPATPTAINPLPGFASASPTVATGTELDVYAQLLPLNYTVLPGTYTATATLTLTAL